MSGPNAFPILLTKNNYNADTGKLVYQFPSSQTFSNRKVGLLNCSFYNCFFNITAEQQNNSLTLQFPTGALTGTSPTYLNFDIVLPDGYYSIDTLNQAIQNYCVNQRLYYYDSGSGLNVYFVQLQANATLYSCQLNCFYVPTATQATSNGWLVPSGGAGWTVNTGTRFATPRVIFAEKLASLLGFTTTSLPSGTPTTATWTNTPVTALGAAAPAINMVSGVILRTNLISQSTGSPSDMLALVPITSQFGAITEFVASHPVFSPVPNGQYPTIEVYFMDQNLRPIKFFDPDITVTLEISDR